MALLPCGAGRTCGPCQGASSRHELFATQGGGTQNKFKSKAAAKGRTKRFSRRGRGRGRGRWAAAPEMVQQGLARPWAGQGCRMAVLLLSMASSMGEGLGRCIRMTHHSKHVRGWQGRLARVTELPIDGEQHTTIRLSWWPGSSPVCTLLVSLTMLQLSRNEQSTWRAGMSWPAFPSCSFMNHAAMSRYLKGLHGLTSRQPDGLLPFPAAS